MEGKSIAARPFGFLRLMPSIASSFISLIGILESPLRHHEAPMQYLDTKIRKALCNEFGVNRSFHIVSPVLSTILESFDRADFNHYPVFSFHSRRSRGCSSSIHFKGRRSISCSNGYQEITNWPRLHQLDWWWSFMYGAGQVRIFGWHRARSIAGSVDRLISLPIVNLFLDQPGGLSEEINQGPFLQINAKVVVTSYEYDIRIVVNVDGVSPDSS